MNSPTASSDNRFEAQVWRESSPGQEPERERQHERAARQALERLILSILRQQEHGR